MLMKAGDAGFDQKLSKHLFVQICEGIHAQHERQKMLNGDIKLENVLIGNDFKMKICDLGLAKSI